MLEFRLSSYSQKQEALLEPTIATHQASKRNLDSACNLGSLIDDLDDRRPEVL